MEVPRRHLFRSFAVACLGIPATMGASGCAKWTTRGTADDLVEVQTPSRLSKSADTIRVELEAINLVGGASRGRVVEDFWSQLDTASIQYKTRARLAANGIRVGVLRRPERLQSIRAAASPVEDEVENFLASADVSGELSRRGRSITLKRGKPQEWPTRHPLVGSHVLLIKEAGEVRGRTLQAPQPALMLQANRSPIDATVEVTLRPEIDHGDAKPSYVASESAIRIDSRRERWSVDCCTIRWLAVDGEALILGRLPDGGPLADLLFQATRPDGQDEESLLAIRYLGD